MSEEHNFFIAQNVKAFRQKRNYTQEELSKLTGIARSTITNIESGESNPSLSNLIKLAKALGVGLDQLVSQPRSQTVLIKEDQFPIELKNNQKVIISKLLPDQIKGVAIDRVQLHKGEKFFGQPHLGGTREYLSVLEGEVLVTVSGEEHLVKENELLAFPGDVPHAYENPLKDRDVTYLSIVIPS